MRTAEICPTCATTQNALCILYNSTYLNNINVNPLDNLETILGKINTNLVPLTGEGKPDSVVSTYLGQLYLDTLTNILYYSIAINPIIEWAQVISIPSTGTPEHSNNSAAKFAGLEIGQVYRTGDFLKIVH